MITVDPRNLGTADLKSLADSLDKICRPWESAGYGPDTVWVRKTYMGREVGRVDGFMRMGNIGTQDPHIPVVVGWGAILPNGTPIPPTGSGGVLLIEWYSDAGQCMDDARALCDRALSEAYGLRSA
jgi:hypothetical protein